MGIHTTSIEASGKYRDAASTSGVVRIRSPANAVWMMSILVSSFTSMVIPIAEVVCVSSVDVATTTAPDSCE